MGKGVKVVVMFAWAFMALPLTSPTCLAQLVTDTQRVLQDTRTS